MIIVVNFLIVIVKSSIFNYIFEQLHETCLDKVKQIVDKAAANLQDIIRFFDLKPKYGELYPKVWDSLSKISNQISDIRDPYFMTFEEIEMLDKAASEFEERNKKAKMTSTQDGTIDLTD